MHLIKIVDRTVIKIIVFVTHSRDINIYVNVTKRYHGRVLLNKNSCHERKKLIIIFKTDKRRINNLLDRF